MKKRILSILLCLCIVFGLLPTTALAAEYADDDYGTIVRVAETTIWQSNTSNTVTYWTCNNNTLTSASAADNWNVKYDPTGTIPTLTLNGFSYTGEKNGVRSSVALKIVLQGSNTIKNTKSVSNDDARYNENHCIFVKDDLTIIGTDGATLTVESQNGNGIMACHPAQSGDDRHTESITIESANITASVSGDVGIVASQSLTIKNSTINSTGKNHGLQGGNFTSDRDPNINISNSTITAKATASGGKAFQSAPTISETYQWRNSDSGSWTASSDSTPDFSQTYLELKPGSAASTEHTSHPICGASCSHSSAHSNVTWTGIIDLTSITSEGNYYLTNDVTLTEAWKPADDVVLCLNGHTITQTNDYETPVIEVEYPKTFTLTDCSNTPGKITHQDGRSGMGVESSNEFIMHGGEISGNPNGGVGAVGRFTLDGGAIRNNTVFGVMITSNEDDKVPGLFTMKSGSIEGNTSYMGGGVYAYATTKPEDVTFTMEGGTIRHNTAVMGGGVYVHGATFNMNGGSICENNVTTSDNIGEDVNGGGVYVSDYVDTVSICPVFNVSGGEISGNVKDGTISGNTLSGGTSNNAYLTAARTIKVSGSLTGTGKIGVTTEVPPADDYAVPITGTNSGDFSSYFASDNAAYETYNDNNVVKLRLKATIKVNAQQPIITVEPVDATYNKGATAVQLRVEATSPDGGTLSYQWWKGDGFTSSEISGATSNTYTPPTNTVGTVEYSCVVTNTIQDNGDGGTKTATKSCSAWITVTEDANSAYSISLDTTSTHTFTAATVGYAAQTAKTVTVSNTGNRTTGDLTVTLSGSNADSFTLSKNSITDIAVSGNDTFTVVPKTGLSAGTYTATVTVSGGNGITASFDVSFTVNAATPTYGIALSQSGTYNFPAATEGYDALTPLTVSVTNTGTADTGSLHVYLTGNNTQFDLVATDVIVGIAPNETKTFTVVPKTGLAASDAAYTAYVTVMNSDKGIEAGFTVKFTVNAADGNTPAPHFHSGGTATCKDEAVCTGCGQPYGSKDSNNHTGGTEVRGKVDATSTTEGYTGDTYCLGCNTKIATGTTIPKKDSGETGGNTGGGDSGNDGSGIDTPPVPDDGEISPAYVTYIVQSGDTLWAIAKKYSCTVSEIVAANSDLIKNPDLIHVGWQIKIPQAGATGADTDTPDAILPDDKKTTVYIVKQGDSLWAISKKYGCTVAEIVALNGELITDPDLIYAGWELKILQD